MKTIGIVGGLAWPSTLIYYQTINELVASRLGGLHCARLVLTQIDFDQVERYQREGRWDLVGDLLAAQAGNLKAAGADFFLLACNTVHTASERIEARAGLPFLHIVDPNRAPDPAGRLHHRRTARLPSRRRNHPADLPDLAHRPLTPSPLPSVQ